MGNNNLYKVENTLRSIAKRYKNIKYSLGLAILFLMMGVGAFSEEIANPQVNVAPTREEIATSRENLKNSVGSLQSKIDQARSENSKSLAGLRLELMQLMEQGDQVVKSPWMSWQFGANYMYNKWNGTYKGRGDKAQKYPFEGVFTRSNDLFLRSVSPDSELYEQYIATVADNAVHSATTSTIKRRGGSTNYGLASVIKNQEPIASIELGASVRPKKISKSPITVTPPSITVNAVTPLSTPQPPGAPQLPQITIEKFNPVAPEVITVNLPTPPTFNIKLGSYRNNMTQNSKSVDGGIHSGTTRSYNTSDTKTITGNDLSAGPAVIYAWSSPSAAVAGANFDSALLKAYFDYTSLSGTGGGTLTVTGNITIDSIRGNITDPDPATRPWNNQDFLVGGSRVATLDNAKGGGTIRNAATINMVGPLVVGYEIQNDGGGSYAGTGKREVLNVGTLTDDAEKGYRGPNGLEGLHVGYGTTPSNSKDIFLAPNLGGGSPYPGKKIVVSRTPDEARDKDGNPIAGREGGYVGYKIGMILTHEYDDPDPNNNYYRLVNGTSTESGLISFKGKSSIGIQVYAPQENSTNTRIEVINDEKGIIKLGGVESYGLKLSSRILDKSANGKKSVFENRGLIEISGSGGNSLSSGMAVIEDKSLTGASSIRAYDDMVQNKGTINVSGGEGNTGMVLITKANDNITNATNKNITVTGAKNIGMRVDLGTVDTDDKSAARISPTAVNNGNISITDGEQNIGMVANDSEGTATVNGETVMQHRAVAHNKSNILFNNVSKKAIGMFASKGGELINEGTIKGNSTSLQETIGMVIQPKDGTKISSATNSGIIELKGKKVVGVYNQGKFNMTGGSVLTSGEKSISMYANNSSEYTKISKGSITAEGGALGLFADNTTMELGASSGTDAPTLNADGVGTLLFYNYTSTNPSGKFKLNQNVSANITNGATAFYYKDSATSALVSQRLNDMFADTGANSSVAGKKLKVKLDAKSTLFVLENTVPSTTVINLSSADPTNINDFLGNRVTIDAGSGAFKAYKVTKGRLSVDKDVNLDNHTGASVSEYYRVDFLNSAVKVEAGKKMYGTDAGKLKQVIAQANYDGATGTSNIDVVNDGTIDYSKKGATAIVVDYGQATNNGLIKMDAANGSTENSIGLFGASSSKLTNSATGEIQLGTRGVGIWGTNKISSSISTWGKNIDITNNGKITGLSGKKGVFGIYAVNDIATYAGATSNIVHGATGNINLSQNEDSIGIYMANGTLTSSGNISVNNKSVGLDATASNVTVSGGTHTIGKESVGFKLTNFAATDKFLGNSGNISMTDEKSVAYLLSGSNFTSNANFKDDLTLASTKAYTYMSLINNSTLNYTNTKTIANDDSIFINTNASNVNLLTGTTVTSTNKKVTGVYSEKSNVTNAGTLTLTGDNSSGIYAKSGSVANQAGGKITVGKDGSGIYVMAIGIPPVPGVGANLGEITIGEGSVGMRAENSTITNGVGAKITSSGISATGMSQSGGSQDITNNGTITLTGDKSTALHSEGITTANHKVINTGDITVGDSSNELTPSVGIYSANGTNSTVESSGKIIAGIKSTGIYAGNVNLIGNSETTAGDAGIAVYSKEGSVNISSGSKITVGATLGSGKEAVGVYLAGNNQTLNSDTDQLTIGQGSFGYVMTGQGNTVRTGVAGTTGVVTLSKDSVYMYSADKTGNIVNYTNLRSTGNENYGIYALGAVSNYGNIDFSQGVGNVGAYSYVEGATTTPNAIRNYGTISVSKTDISDPDNRKYGIGMAAGFGEEVPVGSGNYVVKGLGNIENYGTIKVTTPDSIGMYATGKGSRIYNNGRIELSGAKRNIGIFAENEAEVINDVNGVITTVGTGNVGQIGIAMRKGAILDNRGTIHIDASKGYGLFLAGAIIKNYGETRITTDSGATPIKEITAADTSKEMQDIQDGINKVKIHSPAGAAEAKIIANGRVQTPTVVHVQAIPNRKPNDIPTSSIGMYVDTSGINYTRPITNIGALRGLTQSDLIIGVEATKYTTSKYIQLGQDIIEPYNDMIRTSGIEKWNIYSSSLTWMASITQLPDYTIRNAYLAKIPYTVWAGRMSTPVDKKDTYNFLDGLEQRYGVEGIGTKENQVFQKLNGIGNNEEILFFQAIDEMMGHQYANVQQRVQATGIILDKEFNYLRDEWRTASKDSNKIKTFGTNGEYKTDTAGVIDYKNNAYGVAYIHENEDIKLGRGIGWYTGIVHNTFKFKDIGRSKEHMLQAKVGLLKSVPFDDNNSLNWTISGDIFVGRNRMHRKFLVVDEIFNAKSKYYTYGIGVRNEIGKEFRLSEGFTLRPYAALKLEYGRVSKIREKSGEIKLEVKQNQYFSVRPEIGAEIGFKHYFGMKALRTTIGVAYENELGRVANGKNKARVVDTTADWFNIRGEKEDRKGNVKVDLNVGVDNTRVGVTANVGYDTKGENLRGGLGLRVIF
ncbi:autotransporter-associated N-terminal domain-containing protein [Fusobacterium polymorphum]|uniref:autotransporter-associated N-terminal domain-containing protein n=3 Tax=Fusobacterium TaxID=848 RepID=UPI001C6E6F64|nr:autotransporter-associated N-terminal domain-containing protein [Fusobacterium polymorphum]QYR61301.1 autotransporter-associated N-terminal domain-containing protein [Fusobacterium polymorphum]